MADVFKMVTLRDPVTGDYLVPRTWGTIGYQIIDGEIVPPIAPSYDADTLDGHDSTYFATAEELESLKTSVSNGKSLIASAITDKGVSTASDATFQTMADNIGKIETFNRSKVIKDNVYDRSITDDPDGIILINRPEDITNIESVIYVIVAYTTRSSQYVDISIFDQGTTDWYSYSNAGMSGLYVRKDESGNIRMRYGSGTTRQQIGVIYIYS